MSAWVPFYFLFVFKLGTFFLDQLFTRSSCKNRGQKLFQSSRHFPYASRYACVYSCGICPQRPTRISTVGLVIRWRGSVRLPHRWCTSCTSAPCSSSLGPASSAPQSHIAGRQAPTPDSLHFSWCHDQGIICFKNHLIKNVFLKWLYRERKREGGKKEDR